MSLYFKRIKYDGKMEESYFLKLRHLEFTERLEKVMKKKEKKRQKKELNRKIFKYSFGLISILLIIGLMQIPNISKDELVNKGNNKTKEIVSMSIDTEKSLEHMTANVVKNEVAKATQDVIDVREKLTTIYYADVKKEKISHTKLLEEIKIEEEKIRKAKLEKEKKEEALRQRNMRAPWYTNDRIKKVETQDLGVAIDVPMPVDHQEYLYLLCQEKGLDFKKILGQTKHESRFDVEAIGKNKNKDGKIVSVDYSYMQINSPNIEWLANATNTPKAPLNPYVNMEWGTYMLSNLYYKYSRGEFNYSGRDLDLAVWSAYNRGEYGFEKYGVKHDYVALVEKAIETIN